VLLSILYQLARRLLGLIAVLVRRDLSKDAELLVLRHENAVLRRWHCRLVARKWDYTARRRPGRPATAAIGRMGWLPVAGDCSTGHTCTVRYPDPLTADLLGPGPFEEV
jgi:putative transposase